METLTLAAPTASLTQPLRLSAQTVGGISTVSYRRLAGAMPNPHETRRTRKFRLKDGRLKLAELLPADRSKVEALLDEMAEVAAQANGHQWKLGDLCLQLLALGLSLDVAARRLKEFGYAKSTLGQYAQVAKSYPKSADRKGVSWFMAFEAMRAWKQAPKEIREAETTVTLARKAIDQGLSARGLREAMANDRKREGQVEASAEARRLLRKHRRAAI